MITTDIINGANSLMLVKRMFDCNISTKPIIPNNTKKRLLKYENSKLKYYFDKKGKIGAKVLFDLIQQIVKNPDIDLHSMVITKNGETVLKLSSPNHDVKEPHIVHSMSKSVTVLAIGILIDEGKLKTNDKICDIFANECNAIAKISKQKMTVEHLLTMSTGVQFNETSVYSTDDYIKSFFESATSFPAGTAFDYNSLNTYMLAAIVEKITGLPCEDFIKDKIFNPLGITTYYWEKCPKGRIKGGWGLYLSTEDMAKIGNLYLNLGSYNGKAIISKGFIQKAISKQIKTQDEIGDYDYGYQVWCHETKNGFLLNGMFGQDVFCYPDSNICIAITCGLDDFFQQSEIYNIINNIFFNEIAKTSSIIDTIKLIKLSKKFANTYKSINNKANIISEKIGTKEISGKHYNIISKNKVSTGVMPFILQASQNNYTSGIEKIGFTIKNGNLTLNVTENDTEFAYPIGFDKPIVSEQNYNGDDYYVSVSGAFAYDENENTVLKVKIVFSETANTRYIRFFFIGNEIKILFDESPKLNFFFGNLNYFMKAVSISGIKEFIIGKLSDDISQNIYKRTIAPELYGKME